MDQQCLTLEGHSFLCTRCSHTTAASRPLTLHKPAIACLFPVSMVGTYRTGPLKEPVRHNENQPGKQQSWLLKAVGFLIPSQSLEREIRTSVCLSQSTIMTSTITKTAISHIMGPWTIPFRNSRTRHKYHLKECTGIFIIGLFGPW